MSKQLKQFVVKDLERRFESLTSYILVDYRGLNSAQSFELRKILRDSGIRMSVVPNRLAVRVLDKWGGERPEFSELFRGPTAVLHGRDGALGAAKVAMGWKRKNKDLLAIKGGVLEGEIISASAAEGLSKIPDRPVLIARLLGMVVAPVQRLAFSAQWPLRSLVCAVDAYRKKLEEAAGAAPSPPPGT